jgi:hypothetical protein
MDDRPNGAPAGADVDRADSVIAINQLLKSAASAAAGLGARRIQIGGSALNDARRLLDLAVTKAHRRVAAEADVRLQSIGSHVTAGSG